jgi:hypothetical protein
VADQGDFFAMFRRSDPLTSRSAAAVVLPSLNRLQVAVLEAYRAHGPMSARQAERLEEFSDYGFSTVRKRISELHQAGLLVEAGLDHSGRAPCRIYELAREGRP